MFNRNNKVTERDKYTKPQLDNSKIVEQPKQYLDKNNDGISDCLQNKTIPALVQSNKDLNQYEIDTDPEFESYMYSLQGYEFDPVNNVWVQTDKPIMNEQGIRKIKAHLKPFVNKHSQTTQLLDDTIKEMLEKHMRELIRHFFMRYRLYQTSKEDLSLIFDELTYLCYIIMSKSIGAGQRNAITARTKLTGTTGTQQGFPN